MKSILCSCLCLLVMLGCSSQPAMSATRTADISADTVLQDDGTYKTTLNEPGKLGVAAQPSPADYSGFPGHGRIATLPSYAADSDEMWQVDLRCCDLSGLDVAGRLSDLVQASFDSRTRWPAALPEGFDPDRIMETGKNPGLGLRELHASGITGKGVGIAIVDQSLLTDHVEYADRLRLYEEIHWATGDSASMHAPAVASIAAGKTVGVAPEADLYLIAVWPGAQGADGEFHYNLSAMARAVDRFVEVNAGLEAACRIRVISISLGINPQMGNYEMMKAAIDRAEGQGIHTVFVGSSKYMGMGRDPGADPDDFRSYNTPGYWARHGLSESQSLKIPMDSRCTASPTGANDYVFYREGGMSWAVPYVAGLYALACQVVPDVTWQEFWAAAVQTAVTTAGADNGSGRDFGRIVNPAALIDALRAAP